MVRPHLLHAAHDALAGNAHPVCCLTGKLKLSTLRLRPLPANGGAYFTSTIH